MVWSDFLLGVMVGWTVGCLVAYWLYNPLVNRMQTTIEQLTLRLYLSHRHQQQWEHYEEN